ncbi:MAG: SDR family oxidoreductase [Gammaproteobacteria bacterium]|nr:SDR family oxidoreductase [Gammaproteobacteria bacterium]
MNKVLIIGATSAIAQEVARLYAQSGDHFFLVARNKDNLKIISEDLLSRGAAQAAIYAVDCTDIDGHEKLMQQAIESLGYIDIVLIAYGTLSDQKKCETDVTELNHELNINFISPVSLLTLLANYLAQNKSGTIAVISSVAGDRGRQSNYVYGAAKGGLTVFLQGLRNRLSKDKVNVLTIKPGFVDTPMTKDFKKGLLWVSPVTIAKGIVAAIENKKDVVYLPGFWRWIMLIIKMVPEKIFKKLSL